MPQQSSQRARTLALALILALVSHGCVLGPTITFQATPSAVDPGAPTSLTWSVTVAPGTTLQSVTIDHGVGSVAASGALALRPTAAITYQLTAVVSTPSGTVTSTATAPITLRPRWDCRADVAAIPNAAGYLAVGPASDFIPTCDGWTYVGNTSANTLVERNLLTGATGLSVQLTSAPADLELDAEHGRIYASLAPATRIARIDLETQTVTNVPTPFVPGRLALGPDGKLLITTGDGYWDAELHVYDPTTDELSGGWPIASPVVRYNPPRGELLAGLTRYAFDGVNAPIELEPSDDSVDSDSELEISPDGVHAALTRSNDGDDLRDRHAADPALSFGRWNLGHDYARGIGFDLSSTRAITSTWDELAVWDVARHTKLVSRPATCQSMGRVAFSRGGELAIGYDECDTPRLEWQRVKPTPAVSFGAAPSILAAGGSTTLEWNVTPTGDAQLKSVSISPAVGAVAASGSAEVNVPSTTTYTLTAQSQDASGVHTSTDTVTIEVGAKLACASDAVSGRPSTGTVTLGSTGDVVGSCDGWVLIGDRDANTVVRRNVFTGAVGWTGKLSNAPGDMELDAANARLFVTMPPSNRLATVDLTSGTIDEADVPSPPTSLTLGPSGNVLLSAADPSNPYDRELYRFDPGSGTASAIGQLDGELVRYEPLAGELFAGGGDGSDTLRRYGFDGDGNPFLIEERDDSGGNCQDLSVSPDGAHLAYSCGGGNGNDYSIYDFDPADLTNVQGAWATDYYPTSATFSPSSARLIATNSEELQIFEVATHVKLKSVTSACDNSDMDKVAVSAGGKIAFGRSTCDFEGTPSKLQWLLVP